MVDDPALVQAAAVLRARPEIVIASSFAYDTYLADEKQVVTYWNLP